MSTAYAKEHLTPKAALPRTTDNLMGGMASPRDSTPWLNDISQPRCL
jgi:hypothetical protein